MYTSCELDIGLHGLICTQALIVEFKIAVNERREKTYSHCHAAGQDEIFMFSGRIVC